MLGDNVGRLAELHRRLVFPFCGDEFRATLALGLGCFCHCTLHIVGQYNVFNLDRHYLGATSAITQWLSARSAAMVMEALNRFTLPSPKAPPFLSLTQVR